LLDYREYAEARDRLTHALVLRQELGDLPGIANCLDGIGGLLAAHAKRDDAIRIAGAAEALRKTLQLPLEPMHFGMGPNVASSLHTTAGDFAARPMQPRADVLETCPSLIPPTGGGASTDISTAGSECA